MLTTGTSMPFCCLLDCGLQLLLQASPERWRVVAQLAAVDSGLLAVQQQWKHNRHTEEPAGQRKR